MKQFVNADLSATSSDHEKWNYTKGQIANEMCNDQRNQATLAVIYESCPKPS
jgi:hypothetical protein